MLEFKVTGALIDTKINDKTKVTIETVVMSDHDSTFTKVAAINQAIMKLNDLDFDELDDRPVSMARPHEFAMTTNSLNDEFARSIEGESAHSRVWRTVHQTLECMGPGMDFSALSIWLDKKLYELDLTPAPIGDRGDKGVPGGQSDD